MLLMSTVVWIGFGVAAWLAAAVVVAALVGRMIRQREKQVPRPEQQPSPARRANGSRRGASRYVERHLHGRK
jgi:hypothetical protein